MPSLPEVRNALTTFGLSAFGMSMPVLSPTWTDRALPTVDEENLSLNLETGTWHAPLAGLLRKVEDPNIGVTLVQPNGSPLTGPGVLLTLFPTLHLRLSRLYAQVLEAGARPESAQGLPFRPVPYYFFFAGTVDAADMSGNINCGEAVGQSGRLTIYDSDGMPIDPLAVAATWHELMARHNVLQKRGMGTVFDPNSQVKGIAALAGATATVRVRLADAAGVPYNGAHLTGLTTVNTSNGLFTLKASSGTGSDLTGTITKAAESTSFTAEARRLLLLGPATTGRLTGQFKPPALPTGVTAPRRDFFSLRVVSLKSYLLGEPNSAFDGAKYELKPAVRINEPLSLLADGNDVLGAAAAALASPTQESLAVAQAIDGNFEVPTSTGVNAHWPNFPALGTGVTPDSDGALPINLRNSFNPLAHYFDDGNAATANVDVVLTLNNLPVGAAVRVYERKFDEDAREERGDGAGGVVPASRTLVLLLKDPFKLRRPGVPGSVSIPAQPVLRCDVLIVKRTGESRLYGNVEITVAPATTSGVPTPGTNPFGSATRRGVCLAGVLGLGQRSVPATTPVDPTDAFLQTILALTGEVNPRDASRLPTMARRDLLVAGLASNNWRSVLAGGRLTSEAHNADSRRGAPGGRGGRETQLTGVATQNGRLAYDIARMAFRRTNNLVTRMSELNAAKWNEPAQPAELANGTPATANAGTFAGALLQTIAPGCETPELSLLKDVVQPHLNDLPASFDQLVDLLVVRINEFANRPRPATSAILQTALNKLRNELVQALNNLKDNNTINESTRERLFNELHRELFASIYGRRDAQWALAGAIAKARRFIYIETPGFADTQGNYNTTTTPAYTSDLMQALARRLGEASGLHVMVCTPKFPDFAAGYETFAAYEAINRRARFAGTTPLPPERVVAFHPIGFPGRPSRLETTVVIVDDVWALVGSSTLRRRGLTFDGGSDLVLTDTNLVNGQSPALMNFRRQLMAARLGLKSTETNSFGTLPNPSFTRLRDGSEAFYVIREMLVAGGLGKLDRLWNGQTSLTPSDMSVANPEGLEFPLLDALAVSGIAGLNTAW